MKTTKLIWYALYATVLIAFSLVGCEEVDIYKIDAPSDLQAKIDSIAAAKASVNTGDTTFLNIGTAIVGAEDNSSAWWTAFSDYFAVPTNQLLHLEFINNGTGVNNWNNWNLAVINESGDRDAADYAEYFILRADAYGWGNEDFDLGLLSNNYPDLDGDGDIWNDFRTIMQGAHVTLEVDHSATGFVFVTATAVGTNGTELVMTYNHPVSATEDIHAFLICDGSYFEMKEAYLLPSQVTAIEDYDPVTLTVTGAPESVEIGNENFWGSAVASVTFADGATVEVDSADLSFTVVPDMTTVGEKTVLVAYSKTKLGAYTQAVSAYYTLDVNNVASILEITSMPDITEYFFFTSDPIVFNTKGMEVTATYVDGSTGVLAISNLEIGTISATEGTQNVEVSYVGATGTVSTTVPITLTKGTAQVGATDFSTAWWTAFSDDFNVASGATKTLTMYTYSNGVNNWNSPSMILRKADLTEYAVVRMDNFGWGDGYGTATLSNDWNFDIFGANISGSKVVITVTNHGDNTADIRYDVTYATGETHFQEYAGITVDSSDVNCTLVIEGAYLVLVD